MDMVGKVVSSFLAMVAASYALYYWKDYSNFNSCFSTVDKLKSTYEQNRPHGSHYQIEDGFSRATEFCKEKNYGAAKGTMAKAYTTCLVNRGCSDKRS